MKRLNPYPTTRSRHHNDLRPLNGVPGVYVLYKNKRCYIGVSKDLGSRLRCHSAKYRGWFYVTQRLPLGKARAKERELIRRFESKGFTLLNRVHRLYERHPSVSPQLVYRRKKRGWSEEDANRIPRNEKYVPHYAR